MKHCWLGPNQERGFAFYYYLCYMRVLFCQKFLCLIALGRAGVCFVYWQCTIRPFAKIRMVEQLFNNKMHHNQVVDSINFVVLASMNARFPGNLRIRKYLTQNSDKKRSNFFRLNDTCIKIGLKYDPFCFQRIKAGKLIALYLQPVGVIIKMSVVARFSTINTQSSGQTVTYSTT